jgi:hypothetical protein
MKIISDLMIQVDAMRRIADDTEADMRSETDQKRISFYNGRVCCLREQALNIEDIIARYTIPTVLDPDFPGCPEGCECPPDKGCGIG